MKKVGSFFFPHVATCGAGISKDKPVELGNYPYPIFVSYGSLPVDEVYSITKAMITGYDAYKDSAPGAGGLAADRQTKNWVVPVHPGAVKALKEAGQWTDEQEAHNKELLKRQEVLAAAWADLRQSQSAVGRQGLPRRLDEGARCGAGQGEHAERLRIAHRCYSLDRSKANTVSRETDVTFCER